MEWVGERVETQLMLPANCNNARRKYHCVTGLNVKVRLAQEMALLYGYTRFSGCSSVSFGVVVTSTCAHLNELF